MTYSVSAALQQAIYERLAADPGLEALVGTAVFDGVPPGAIPPLYVSIGEEQVTDRSDYGERGALHEFEVAIVSDEAGFAVAKAAAGAVSDALLSGSLTLARGRCDGLWFRRAHARRMRRTGTRRIDLRFRARVFDEI